MQVGQGAYGDVWMAEDVINRRWVALKKLKMNEEREGFPKTAIREITLLNSLRHRNIVALHGVVFSKPRKDQTNEKGNVWMVFEYLPFDLSGYLQALKGIKERQKERFCQPNRWLSIGEIKYIMQQLLCALQYCHKNNVIHRDVKSANLLMDFDGTLKLADFGLARFYDINIPQLTNRVITLWYRPPELLLGGESYGTPVDLWSVGCILGELLCSTPLFAANKESQMLKTIAERLGIPSEKNCRALKSLPMWNQIELNPIHPDHPYHLNDDSSLLQETIKKKNGAGEKGWDLLKKLLAWSPKDRITAQEAIHHDWFKVHPFPERLNDRSDVRAAHSYQTKQQKYKKTKDPQAKKNTEIKHVNAGDIRINMWLKQRDQLQIRKPENLSQPLSKISKTPPSLLPSSSDAPLAIPSQKMPLIDSSMKKEMKNMAKIEAAGSSKDANASPLPEKSPFISLPQLPLPPSPHITPILSLPERVLPSPTILTSESLQPVEASLRMDETPPLPSEPPPPTPPPRDTQEALSTLSPPHRKRSISREVHLSHRERERRALSPKKEKHTKTSSNDRPEKKASHREVSPYKHERSRKKYEDVSIQRGEWSKRYSSFKEHSQETSRRYSYASRSRERFSPERERPKKYWKNKNTEVYTSRSYHRYVYKEEMIGDDVSDMTQIRSDSSSPRRVSIERKTRKHLSFKKKDSSQHRSSYSSHKFKHRKSPQKYSSSHRSTTSHRPYG
ncbi:putative cell-cycle-associated protein kinase CDK [Cardiosporidium cionae]|uniref:Cyclin-dependent kinase 2 homolog n=1 Tax=Cardiosporidium cionae TaxID=476202 RepID=A0ABQ7J5N1_9APIC|nr:putative cell-cycle-associated protein kinase CDK [Cardiosporidium cionae]|eukprot:KAF8819258.1 putative cell-cycle-associated protein kinase CDK [Cardiosporidium cionae]